MSVTEDQIIKDVQKVCTQAVALGKHLDLTVRGVIQQLIDEMKHDEEFVNSKPIKRLIKTTAAECLQPVTQPEPDPTDGKQAETKDSADQPEETATQKDSVDQPKETKEDKKDPLALPDQSSAPPSRPPSKKRARTSSKGVFKSAEMVDSDGNSIHEDEESTVKPASKPKVKRERKSKGTKKDGSEQESKKTLDKEQKSDDDEKPTSSTPAPKSGKGKRRESVPVDKDEERIKKLKSFVVACGVRKQWKKEFQDLTTNKQQIQRLTKILEELGMTGRLSMVKAKEIKARRDLEAEVSELVATRETESSDDGDGDEEAEGEQDQKAGDGDEKKSSVKKRRKNRAVNASSGDESSDAPNKPRPKKNPFAFLGDQGSDDSS
ncbi:hypothetical protein PGT21_026397 [Puccinia graminis f. sp. tritici]|uniref:Uncharacterized protein n=1 Tax=Puccinia graminis f. sp. tritici TaxID=56615 RepID=A0A5B0PAB7_PUCGR|nr:hypothetical protein PGT21_026397 [Puccinia graminis f. sp. tritici]KAA1117033.1 hypothetical protein PGTUg99_034462 [Puccinia graminis f. sp. tritici]